MKTKALIVSLIAALAILFACSDDPGVVKDIADGRATPPTPQQQFDYHTHNLDKNGQALACGNIYKLIGDSCVLLIDGELKPQVNYGHIIIDSTNRHLVELWIFEKGKASLRNMCTDLIVTVEGEKPAPAPLRIHPENGTIQMAEETTTENSDGIAYTVPVRSALVLNLKFRDLKGRTIILKDELIWKVKDSGTPG